MSLRSSSSQRTGSFRSRPSWQGQILPTDESRRRWLLDVGATTGKDDDHDGSKRSWVESTSSGVLYSPSLNQTNPVRSYYSRSSQGSPYHGRNPPHDVREDTAELAGRALSGIEFINSGNSATRQYFQTPLSAADQDWDSYVGQSGQDELKEPKANQPPYPAVILEVSESTSPNEAPHSRPSSGKSTLTEMIRKIPTQEEVIDETEDGDSINDASVQSVTIGGHPVLRATERTALLRARPTSPSKVQACRSVKDLESQDTRQHLLLTKAHRALKRSAENAQVFVAKVFNPKSWDRHSIWTYSVKRPAGFLSPITLGLLLNILDGLSYGMILFPLGQDVFAGLGPDGLSMFYVSCIVSQLVYSAGGSVFKGGIGSEMIEVVPFFHKMALTVLAKVGEKHPESVIATTITAYATSSILTGVVFLLMGYCKLGSLIGFFPRHILIGCIGGVGWFLVATGVEVSARLDGNLEYNLTTLQKLFRSDTVALWIIPLALAVALRIIKRWVKLTTLDSIFYISIIAIFHCLVAAIPDLGLSQLRSKGWVFEAPQAGVPFYHFYTLYNFRLVDWAALASTIPAMFALTFFGVLHVPINIPALAVTTGEDNLDIDRELKAHGLSNALSGACGSIQNYLVYSNTVIFMRSGGNNRIAGVILAVFTFGVMVIGPVIIGFIPVMVVGALIFYLGFELLWEALRTWGQVHLLEYITIIAIIVTMGAWDFVIGILVGILLACVSFVVQMSQISAIRGIVPGSIARSTVRRHPIQRQYLQDAGRQIYTMKLAGHLFFGTIVGVENRIRALLLKETLAQELIRFLVLDFSNVDGVDYSATEAFIRINRILSKTGVKMVLCGNAPNSEVGRSLRAAGLFETDNKVELLDDLNSALEYCENELLKTLYQHLDHSTGIEATPKSLQAPKEACPPIGEIAYSSPRRNQLQHVARVTLSEQVNTNPQRWKHHEQPLQLIGQTFSSVSDKKDDFWKRIVFYFCRKEYAAGTTLYERDETPDAFYLLETGMLKAEYYLLGGKFTELIVAGTTCGELPFFSDTKRTSKTVAERHCVTWMLDSKSWREIQKTEPDIAQELLKISLKLTSERMDAITKYMLLTK